VLDKRDVVAASTTAPHGTIPFQGDDLEDELVGCQEGDTCLVVCGCTGEVYSTTCLAVCWGVQLILLRMWCLLMRSPVALTGVCTFASVCVVIFTYANRDMACRSKVCWSRVVRESISTPPVNGVTGMRAQFSVKRNDHWSIWVKKAYLSNIIICTCEHLQDDMPSPETVPLLHAPHVRLPPPPLPGQLLYAHIYSHTYSKVQRRARFFLKGPSHTAPPPVFCYNTNNLCNSICAHINVLRHDEVCT